MSDLCYGVPSSPGSKLFQGFSRTGVNCTVTVMGYNQNEEQTDECVNVHFLLLC